MKKWALEFWIEEGKRIIYMLITTAFGAGFILEGGDKLQGAGITLLSGVAMMCFNKARGTNGK
jgi:hypothetical protein